MAKRRKSLEDLITELAPDETYEEFAERCGLSVRALWLLRMGKFQRPQRSTLKALAEGLEITIEELREALDETLERASAR